MDATRFDEMEETATRYGELSLENYARVRSLAERIATGFCDYLNSKGPCVHLVPPTGPFAPQPYGSGAFSVSGQGFLLLAPISFGLAVKISKKGDWIRFVLHCAKEGEELSVSFEGGRKFDFRVPVDEGELKDFLDMLYAHVKGWFEESIDRYVNGSYGSNDMGFELRYFDEEDAES